MVEVYPSQLAADVLARVLCSERLDIDAASGRLRVSDADRVTVRALLPLLDGLRVDEWTSHAGAAFRDYIGCLPCGLQLVISTDADRVPLVELPEGGGQGG